MALVLETGAGLNNSNSYVSVAEADAYFSQFDNQDWQGLNSAKESALIKATKAVDLLFGARYKSTVYSQEQSLLFPRYPFYINQRQFISSTGIPKMLKEACSEVALKSINDEEIFPNLTASSNIKSENFSLGPISESVTYNGAVTNETLEGFYKIELILRPILNSLETTFGYRSL